MLLSRKAGLLAVALLLAGCPSKEGEQRDANAGGSGGPVGQGGPTGATAPPSGPLAGLESSPFMNEVWNLTGQQVQILHYARENVRVSAQCRNPAGQLGCAALTQIRGGAPPVVVMKSELSGKPAGALACKKLNNGMMAGVNQAGDEEQFCRFPDGSWLSTNTLEQYGIKIQ
jgi:hypothetical protein